MERSREKRTYKIGDVAKKLDLEPYVLRFWENEFPQLQPIRSPKGQRLYTEDHIVLISRIKNLLYEQGLTIEGAKRRLDENADWLKFIKELETELQEIKNILLKSD